MPTHLPTMEDQTSEDFNALWDFMKHWYSNDTHRGRELTGRDVIKLLIALKLRDEKNYA